VARRLFLVVVILTTAKAVEAQQPTNTAYELKGETPGITTLKQFKKKPPASRLHSSH
jgi:hypothetical protein